MVGMADGFAQASGRPDHVNLHTAPGVGNAVGGIFNAQANKSPLLITAGQQVRPQITYRGQPHQPRSRARPRAVRQVEPRAAARPGRPAGDRPRDPPRLAAAAGPGVRVDPDGRLGRPRPTRRALAQLPMRASTAASPTRRSSRLAGRCRRPPTRCWSPAPTSTRAGGWDAAVALADKQRLPVWATPATGGGRIGFPETTPTSSASCRRRSARVAQTLTATTWSSWSAPRCSPTTRIFPARCCRRARRWCRSPATPARPPGRRWARRSSAMSGWRSGGCSSCSATAGGRAPAARAPGEPPSDPISGSAAMAALPRSGPGTGSPSSRRPPARSPCATACACRSPAATTSAPAAGSASASPPSVGVQLAQPARPVVCVLGEGSAQYGITALWTAATYKVPVTFLVLRNEEYMILKWFAELEGVAGAPGLDLPGLDVAASRGPTASPRRSRGGRS